ncbi:hypothetical protein Vafri_12588 [Volvox africanus]|uniref:Uncharacterized protein n=2 Tax=Volvox africanus TaxID=51714 RepID=A0A8J4F4K2_9CHLO|nr:hypothetical protein Vafri_12588 [Volvox africanus]
MPNSVDVFITEAELAEGRRAKRTTCMKVDPEALRPVNCVSRSGISSGTLFTRSDPQRTGRYLTDNEMATMFNKFVGPNSLNNAAVRLEQEERDASVQPSPSASTSSCSKASRTTNCDSGDRTPPPPSASLAVAMAAAGCDVPSQVRPPSMEEARERGANAAMMKYVSPKIAKKYGVQQSITPAGPRAAAAAAARAGGGRGGASRGVVGASAADRLQAADSISSYSGGDNLPPRPQSAAFKTTSRDQAQRVGSHFVFGCSTDVPAPGKYNPKYGATDKAQHAPLFSKPVATGTDDGAPPNGVARSNRPGSAPAGGRGSDSSRPASAPTHRTADDSTDPSVPHDAQAAAVHSQPGALAAPQRRGLSRSLSSQGGHTRLTAEGRAQLLHRHEELFYAAHRVHKQRPSGPPGSQPFKATERKSLYDTVPVSQLFGEYYKEGYDSLTRRSTRPSSAFRTQSQRQYSNGPLGETGPTVGPGTYGKELPGTKTGRHVQAGHPGLTRTPDWSRTTPRPTSAPPGRSPPSSALFHGYYGPDGPIISLFPDEPEYNEINAVRILQERTSQRVPGLPPRAPSQNQQKQQQQGAAAGAGGSTSQSTGSPSQLGTAGGGGGLSATGAGTGTKEPILVYVDPTRYGELTSSGLAKRVPGGTFGTATREASCHAMRVIAKPNVAPPAAVMVKPANDLSYDYNIEIEGHRGRPPAWALPPNRNALSQQWMAAAATAYLS